MEFILPAAITLILIMLWAFSMAALYKAPYETKNKYMLGVLFIVIPPAAIVWLGKELYLKYEMSRDVSKRGNL